VPIGIGPVAVNQGLPTSHALREQPRPRDSFALVLALLSALVLMFGAQAFVSARRELAAYDEHASSALERAAQSRALFLREVVLEQGAFLLCGTMLALALYLVARRHLLTTPRRALDPEQVIAETKSHLADLRELHNANRLATVGRLTAGMAHEFGTPLGVVLARAQMIRLDEGSLTEMQEDADAIIAEVKRMTQMCREVLDYARPTAPMKTPTEIVQIARHMLVLLLPDVRKRNVKLSLAGDPQPVLVLGDPSKLTQIFTNLIINALQAMPKGGTVTLHVEKVRMPLPEVLDAPERSYACVRVEDTGTGIRAADIPYIFDTFFTTKKEGEGTGLGLAVSSRIAREHGGWIAVKTEEGRGACFSVYLPVADVGRSEQAAEAGRPS
jgi:signal transduction histidine kinase